LAAKRYISAILPLRLDWEPCYSLPGPDIFGSAAPEVSVGSRVKVRNAGHLCTAVVSAVDIIPDIDPSRILDVEECDTGLERVSSEELEFWRFIADYYCCTVGEVYKAAYPLPKTTSEEVHVRAARRREVLLEKEKELWRKRIAKLSERLKARDRALASKHKDAVRERLRAERAGIATELAEAQKRLDRLNDGLFGELPKAVRLFSGAPAPELSAALKAGKPILLKSVSRIETYRNLAAGYLEKGRSVLLLVPEIKLAKSLQKEFSDSFGELLAVHHPEKTHVQRRKISDLVRSGNPCIVLGTRSSIFLPFKDLGLIIVDGEQSAFYKQAVSSPRYNARDAAVMLAKIHGASVILGTSSPSLESLLNARSGRYSLVGGSWSAQELRIVDTKAERRKNGMLGSLSRKLVAECRALPEGRIAFIRGYEKAEELAQNLQETMPDLQERIDVFTIPEASKTDLSAYELVALLSADALFKPEDFRSDEHAFQFLDSLRSGSGKVIVQTANPAHQVFSLQSAEPLLAERQAFSLPPYTRLVDILLPDCRRFGDIHSAFARNLSGLGFKATDALPRPDGRSLIRITLPRDRQLQANKKALYAAVQAFRTEHRLNTGVIIDADPV